MPPTVRLPVNVAATAIKVLALAIPILRSATAVSYTHLTLPTILLV